MKKLFVGILVWAITLTALAQSVPVASPVATPDPSMVKSLKLNYDEGMRYFHENNFELALPELLASAPIGDVAPWQTWFDTAYSTIGVIYDFHVANDDKAKLKAYKYFQMALDRNPKNVTAKLYLAQLAQYKNDATTFQLFPTPSVTPTGTPRPHWIAPPEVKAQDQFVNFVDNVQYQHDVTGFVLNDYFDMIVHRKLDLNYNATADSDIRIGKSFSNSYAPTDFEIRTLRVAYVENWLSAAVGRLDVGSQLSPTGFFGNYLTMGLRRLDGVELVLPISFSIGVQDLDSFKAPPTALSLFYFPSILSSAYENFNESQALIIEQLRVSSEAFGLPFTFRFNFGQSASDISDYSSINGNVSMDGSLDVKLDKDIDIYAEGSLINPSVGSTSVITEGAKISKIYTLGPISFDSLTLELQTPLQSDLNNPFTGGNAFNSVLAQPANISFFGTGRIRLKAIYFDFSVTNNQGDFTWSRLNQSNSGLTSSAPMGISNETPGLGVPIQSQWYNTLAYSIVMGTSF